MAWETNSAVVIPIDFSGMSIAAVEAGLKLAASPDLIHVVHVVPVLDQIAPETDEDWQIPTDGERRDQVHENFHSFLKEQGLPELRQVVLEGEPGPQIAEYATAQRAGLIVIPSHGYQGLKRILLGSVAEQVIRLATCPVFVVRREDAE